MNHWETKVVRLAHAIYSADLARCRLMEELMETTSELHRLKAELAAMLQPCRSVQVDGELKPLQDDRS